jgi:hypothetical protein
MALVEDRFLVGEVVVERGLADVQTAGDILERRGVIATIAEGAEGRVEDRFAATPLLPADMLGRGGGRWHGFAPSMNPVSNFELEV